MKAVVAAFNQEKALVGAFSVVTNLRMELFQALQGRPRWRGPASSAVYGVGKLVRNMKWETRSGGEAPKKAALI